MPDQETNDRTASRAALADDLASKRLSFLGLGTVKAGTTWLMRCLEDHPSIEGPAASGNKEIHFFNATYEHGYVWYHSQFAWRAPVVGEFATQYLASQDALRRIREYRPDIKLIASLRDPLSRAWSHYKHHLREGLVTSPQVSFLSACQQNPSFVELGRYGEQLQRLFDVMPREQCRIVLYDDIRADPWNVVRGTYEFLGVDPSFSPATLHERVNPTREFRSRRMQTLARSLAVATERRFGAAGRRLVDRTRARELWQRFNERPADEVALEPPGPTEAEWFAERLGDDVGLLSALLKRDLSGWLSAVSGRQI